MLFFQFGTLVFFNVYYSLLLPTSLREREVLGLQGRIIGFVNQTSVE